MNSGRRRKALCGKHPGGPWYGDCRARMRFERRLREHAPDITRQYVRSGPCRGLRYRTTVTVPGGRRHTVDLLFARFSPEPRVYADGPSDSPHRYHDEDGRLCMWSPTAAEDRRWVLADGLVRLIGMAVRHLFCEQYWRETDDWPGAEASHTGVKMVTKMACPPRWARRARG